MAADTRSGFRLPWGAGPGEPGDQSENGVEPGAREAQVPTMIETEPASDWPAQPDVSVTSEPLAREAVEPVPAPQPTRRSTRFMAELSRAMQAAVENARTEAMARFEVEAKTVVEEIQANAATEAADLRTRADGDVAGIRDWSKAEIARVREETESRITARKDALEVELVDHDAVVETRTARIATVVAAYEAELAAFFERLNAEEDPTRIATMAETMPEPPSLAEIAASVSSAAEPSVERFERLFPSTEPQNGFMSTDLAAAEAEAASFDGDLENEAELLPPDTESASDSSVDDSDSPVVETTTELSSTRVVVSGLVSVANIANFKRSLGHVSGVSSIAVASGRDGDFAFTVGHTLGSALAESVRTLPGFEVAITTESEEAIVVSAKDRETNG